MFYHTIDLLKEVNDMSKSDRNNMSRSEKRNANKNNKKSPKRSGGLWKKILLGIVGIILVVGVLGLGLFAYYASSAPELTEEDLVGTYSSELVDMNGEVFYSLGGNEREFATAEEYPDVLKDAVMAIEDQRFLNHRGIDPIGIARAAVGYVTNQGEIVGGGSTITQQLIKNSVFSTKQEDQTLERKAQEAWLAVQLEQELSKEQIMTLYLNKIHMGGNVYGAATAAEEYYGKHVSELELHEAAMLAAMPKATNLYNPYVNEEAAENRRNVVLAAMVDFGAITQQQADEAAQIPVTEGLQAPEEEDENYLVFDAYLSAVLQEIQEKTAFENPSTAGLTIYTNYDPDAQQLMYDVANTDEYVQFPNDEIQTAMTLMDSSTGKVTALIGGRNSEAQLSTNRAITGDRGIGSTIKPLTTYGPAIEFLEYSTYHQVYDEPYTLGNWSPGNYDGDYEGQMSMRDALVDSRNVPTAKLFNEDLGDYHDEIKTFLDNIGVDMEILNREPNVLVPQNALNGTMTPLQLTGAYGAFANNGNYTEPYTVTRIVTQDGEEIDLTPETNKVMEDSTAYMVNDMLKDVVPYYGSSLNIPGYIHAAKTGTTNYESDRKAELNIPSDGVPDNWVVGYSPYYTMAVWVGYDRMFDEGNYLHFGDRSRVIARDIYRESMSRLVEGFETRDWQQPESVVELSIENGTDPAQIARPGSSNAVSELFVRSNVPTATAEPEEPETFNLSAVTGLSARYMAEADDVSISWDAYDNLPDDFDGNVQYVLSINGQAQVISATEYLIPDPPREVLDISVAVRIGDQTGPATQITLIVPGAQEEPEPDQPEEEPEENQVEPEPEPEEPEEPVEEPVEEPNPDSEPENPEPEPEPEEPDPNTEENPDEQANSQEEDNP